MRKRVAVISDIHANAHALEVVWDDIQKQNVSALWCLGDILGRGLYPIETIKLLKEISEQTSIEVDWRFWLAGNHDLIVMSPFLRKYYEEANTPDLMRNKIALEKIEFAPGLDPRDTTGYTEEVLKSDEKHRDKLVSSQETEVKDWFWEHYFELCKRPSYTIGDEQAGIYLCHGGLKAINEENPAKLDESYAFTYFIQNQFDGNGSIQAMKNYAQARNLAHPHVLLSGHTHRSGIWQWKQGQNFGRALSHKEETCFKWQSLEGIQLLVNVGSVGFPRWDYVNDKGDTCPTYVILSYTEASELEIEFRTVTYDWSKIEIPENYNVFWKTEMTACK